MKSPTAKPPKPDKNTIANLPKLDPDDAMVIQLGREDLRIKVTGRMNGGKSTLSLWLEDKLKAAGAEVWSIQSRPDGSCQKVKTFRAIGFTAGFDWRGKTIVIEDDCNERDPFSMEHENALLRGRALELEEKIRFLEKLVEKDYTLPV